VIFRHQSPLDGEIEEKHLKSPPAMPADKLPHLYTLAGAYARPLFGSTVALSGG